MKKYKLFEVGDGQVLVVRTVEEGKECLKVSVALSDEIEISANAMYDDEGKRDKYFEEYTEENSIKAYENIINEFGKLVE